MNNNHGALKEVAVALNQEINNLQRQIDYKKSLLEALGRVCDHPKMEMYRQRQVGICEFCFQEFLSKGDVDQIFSG